MPTLKTFFPCPRNTVGTPSIPTLCIELADRGTVKESPPILNKPKHHDIVPAYIDESKLPCFRLPLIPSTQSRPASC